MGQIQFQVPGDPPPTSSPSTALPTSTVAPSGGSTGGGQTSDGGSPTYDDDSTVPDGQTVAEQFAANLAAVGAIVNPDSLQPVAPQAPGNVLAGSFGTSSSVNWKVIVVIVLVAIVGFYAWKKYRG